MVLAGVGHVVRRGLANPGQLFLGDRSLDLGGASEDQALGRHPGPLGNQRARSHDGILADLGAVHHDGAHADQDAIPDGTPVEEDPVADGDVAADHQRVGVMGDMEHGQVLDVGAAPDPDVVDVPADHRVAPDAGVGADHNIADDDGGFIQEHGRIDLRKRALKGANHGRKAVRQQVVEKFMSYSRARVG